MKDGLQQAGKHFIAHVAAIQVDLSQFGLVDLDHGLDETIHLTWLQIVVLERQCVVLNLLYDREHYVHRTLALLLENVRGGLVEAALRSRVQIVHDFLELELLDYLLHLSEHLGFAGSSLADFRLLAPQLVQD